MAKQPPRKIQDDQETGQPAPDPDPASQEPTTEPKSTNLADLKSSKSAEMESAKPPADFSLAKTRVDRVDPTVKPTQSDPRYAAIFQAAYDNESTAVGLDMSLNATMGDILSPNLPDEDETVENLASLGRKWDLAYRSLGSRKGIVLWKLAHLLLAARQKTKHGEWEEKFKHPNEFSWISLTMAKKLIRVAKRYPLFTSIKNAFGGVMSDIELLQGAGVYEYGKTDAEKAADKLRRLTSKIEGLRKSLERLVAERDEVLNKLSPSDYEDRDDALTVYRADLEFCQQIHELRDDVRVSATRFHVECKELKEWVVGSNVYEGISQEVRAELESWIVSLQAPVVTDPNSPEMSRLGKMVADLNQRAGEQGPQDAGPDAPEVKPEW